MVAMRSVRPAGTADIAELSRRTDADRSQRRFVAFSEIMAGVIAVNGVVVPAMMGLAEVMKLSLAVLALFAAAPLLVRRRPAWTSALAHAEFGIAVLAVVAVARIDTQMQAMGVGYLAIVIAAAAYILGVRAAFIWTVVSIVAVIVSAATAEFSTDIEPRELPITASWLNLSRCLLLLAFFSIAAAGRRFADRQAAELEYLAAHDSLTGSLTGHALRRRLTDSLGADQHATTAVLFIDLDHFKRINDTYGHATGDEVLRHVSERLRGAVREHDIVGRIGGDEFVVALVDADPSQVGEISERIVSVLNQAVTVDNTTVQISASVGVDYSPTAGTSIDQLFSRADAAMYMAKRDGGHRSIRVPG